MKKLGYLFTGFASLLLCCAVLASPPSPPQNVQQAWLGSESLLLWDEAPGATSYNIYRSDHTNTTWALVGSSTVPRFRDPGYQFLPSFYVITSVNADGEGSGSELSTVSFADQYVVTHFGPQQWNGTLSPTNAIVQWYTDDVNGSQGLVDWGLDATNFTSFAMNTNYLPAQAFNLTNLTPLTFYYYRLTSINSNRSGVVYIGSFGTPDTNHPPVAEDYFFPWTLPSGGIGLTLRGYDSNMPPQALTFRIVSAPTNGTVSDPVAGWEWNTAYVTYTAVPSARGYDRFQFVVNNGTWDSAPATVTVTNWFNTPPATTNGGFVSTPEDTPIVLQVPMFDAEGDPLTFQFGEPWRGTISGTLPNIVFTPETNYNGMGSVWWTVSDGYEQTMGWFTIDVTPVNDKPTLTTNGMPALETYEDYSHQFYLWFNDIDYGGSYETVVVTPPAHGTITSDYTSVTYRGATNFFGTDTFTLALLENGMLSDPQTYTITVLSLNDPPVAQDQDVTTPEDTAIVITPTAFDVDSNSNFTFRVSWMGWATNGWVEETGTNFIYHPYPGYNGTDAFQFDALDDVGTWGYPPGVIRIQVSPVGEAPTAAASWYTGHQDAPLNGFFNVADSDLDSLTCEIVVAPSNGIVTVTGTNFVYQPASGYQGPDTIVFRAFDGVFYSDVTNVFIGVNGPNTPPEAIPQTEATIRDSPATFSLNMWDNDGDTVTANLVDAPTNGTVTFNGNYVTYTPAPDFYGTDSFTYQPYDGFATGNLATVTISVTPQNRRPTGPTLYFNTTEETPKAFDVSMTDPDGDSLTYSTVISASHGTLVGTFPFVTYVPNTNFSGMDYILYWAFDGQEHSLQTWIIIDVYAVNDAPVAIPGSVTVVEDNSVVVPLTGSDADGDALTVIVQSNPSHGTLTNQSGTFRYFPATNFSGSDSVVFRVSDGSLQSADATVSLTVTPVNDAPVRVSPDRGYTISEDWYRIFDTQASDADGDVLTYRIVTQPSHGTVTKQSSNTWRYQPAWNWSGDDLLTWVASDGQVDCAIGTVWFHVVSENDRPLTGYDSLTNAEDTVFAVTLWSSDVEGSPLTYTILTPPTNGVLSGSGSNRIYTPNPNFVGGDSLTYKVNDGQLDSSFPGTILFTVTNINDAPIANPSSVGTVEDTGANITLTGSDADGDALTFAIVNNPANGTLAGTPPNLVYTPNANFFGADAFAFSVFDGVMSSAPATVSISVVSVNDAPVANTLSVTTAEDTAVNITLTASDLDNDPLSFTIITNPTHGTLSGTAPNLIYTPATDYFGSDSFVFAVSDGTATSTATFNIDVTAASDLPAPENLRRRFYVTQYSWPPANTNLHLWWHGVSGADSYNIYRADGTNAPLALLVSGVAATNYVDTTSEFGHFYTYQVTAVNAVDEGSPATTTALLNGGGLIEPNENGWGMWATRAHVIFCNTLIPGGEGQFDWGLTTNYTFSVDNTNLLGCHHVLISNLQPETVYYYRIISTDLNGNATVYRDSFVTAPAPFGNPQDVSLNEDTFVDITLTGQDPAYNGWLSTLTYSVVSGVSNGALVALNADTYRYTPGTNFNGTDSFTFKVNNGELDGPPSTVSITVGEVNDLPEAADISLTTAEDAEATIPASFTDVDGGPIASVQIVSQPAHGSADVSGTNLVYLPATNFSGADSFTYSVSDGYGFGSTATVFLTVTNVEDSPVAFAQSVTAAEDANRVITLAGVDPDGDAITFSILTSPSHGTLSGTAPNLTYRPATNYNGSDSFSFQTYDGKSFSAPATVSITVTPVNDAPIALPQSLTVGEDLEIVFSVNATDVDSNEFTFEIITSPTNGTLNIVGTNYTYRPATNFNGGDSLTFRAFAGTLWSVPATVSITVSSMNDSPIVANQNITTLEDSSVSFAPLASDVEGDALTFAILTVPTNGIATVNAGNLVYTPSANYNGADSFEYQAHDSNGGNSNARVFVTVQPVNDAPVAHAQNVTLNEDGSRGIELTGTDIDGDGLSFAIVNGPVHGALSGTVPNVVYTPAANYNGSDSFTFVVNDGTTNSVAANVNITVTTVNDAPVANAQNVTLDEDSSRNIELTGTDLDGDVLSFAVISGPAHGTLSGTPPNVVYAPAANYNGTDNFTFRANDSTTNSVTVSVILTVTAVNDAPVADNGSRTLAEDTSAALTLTASDIEGDTLTFSIVTGPLHGTLSGTGANVTYTPTTNYNGNDSFSFTANDGTTESAPATVAITITPVNDRPVPANTTVTLAEDTSAIVTLSGSDVEGSSLAFTLWTLPQNGTITGTAPNLTYTPYANFNGSNSFQFIVSDGSQIATGTVTLVVTPVNDAPVAADRSITLNEDWIVTTGVSATDIDGDPRTYRVNSSPLGTLNFSPNGAFSYRGPTNYNGVDSFTFVANDGTTDGNTATVTITLTPMNDMPSVTNQMVSTLEDTALAITPAASDVDGDTLTFTIVDNADHGSVTWNGTQFVYTPATNYTGLDSFGYLVEDPTGGHNSASITINVQGVNDAPIVQSRAISTVEDTAVAATLIGTDVDGDVLTYRIISAPTNGVLSGSGSARVYTPNSNVSGTDSFTYTVNDGTVDANMATITLTITSVNDWPVANPQSVSLNEDGSLPITLTGSDVEGSPLTFQITSNPTHGWLTGTAPNVTYNAYPNYNGPDSFSFFVNDGNTPGFSATVSISVTPVPDAPIANSQLLNISEDTSVAITLTAVDYDGDPLTYSIVSAPVHGTLTGTPPNLTYTPPANLYGTDSFTFVASDGTLSSSTKTVNINIAGINDAPVANAQSVTVTYNTAKTVTLTGSDEEGSGLTYSVVTGPTNGTLSGTAPNLTYTPAVGSAGTDFFTFRVNDGSSNSAPATVSITTLNPTGIPAAPSGLNITVPTATGTLILNWNCSATNEDGFKIERSLNSGSGWAQIATTGINTHTFTNTGLTSGTRYYYRVRSYNRLGNSAYSNTVNAKPR